MDVELPAKFNLWLFDSKDSNQTNSDNFFEKVKNVIAVRTPADFITMYAKLRKPKDLHNGCEVYYFKEGIKPLWEDPENENGGSFFMHIKKTFANRIWENILLAVAAQNTDEVRLINGIIIRVLTLEVVFFMLTKRLTKEQEARMIVWVKETAGLSSKIKLEFKPHPRSKPHPVEEDPSEAI